MNERKQDPAGGSDRRRGIALVIVLGLMAMLIVMGLSFATSMRTERRAARMSGYQLGSLELTYYALAEAMNQIENDLGSQSFTSPNWGNLTIHTGNNGNYPSAGTNNSLLSWYHAYFVPGAILGVARAETNFCLWRRVNYPDGREAGIFAYMIVDCGGLLDFNGNHETDPRLAKAIPRGPGTNVSELALNTNLLRELRGGQESRFVNSRVGTTSRFKPFGRAETLPDALIAGYAMYTNQTSVGGSLSPLVSSAWYSLTNFYVLSRYPSGYSLGGLVATQQTYIGGSATELRDRHDEIFTSINALLRNPAESETFFNNLIDFVDPDIVPGGLEADIPANGNNADSYCTEPVPMLNELQIITILRQPNPSVYELTARFRTELIFPFAFTSNYPAIPPMTKLRIKCRYEGGAFTPNTFTVDYTNSAPSWVRTPSGMSLAATHFSVLTRDWTSSASSTNAALPERMVIEEWSVLDQANRVLDRIAPGAGGVIQDLKFNEYFVPSSLTLNALYACSWTANDPRINWSMPSHWELLYSGRVLASPDADPSNSFGRMNPKAGTPSESGGERGDPYMYVHNGPLRSVGDLGYLLYFANRPWQTVNLIGPSVLAVLDRFTVFTNDVRYGLVNMNTTVSNVLATAFFNCAVELAPGVPAPVSGGRITAAEALELAGAVMAGRPAQGFQNLSLIRQGNLHDTNSVVPRIVSWQAREGLVRNTCGLLGVRNNVFSIVMSAQSRRQVLDPETGAWRTGIRVASHHAMATVWRDPWKVNGRNKMYVHTFRWYDEWVGGVDDFSSGGP